MRPGDRRVLGRQLGTGGCRLFVAALLPERLGALTLDEERVEGKENDADQVESEINVTIQNTYLPSLHAAPAVLEPPSVPTAEITGQKTGAPVRAQPPAPTGESGY